MKRDTRRLTNKQGALLCDLLLYLVLNPLSTSDQRDKELSLGDVLARHDFDAKKVKAFLDWMNVDEAELCGHAGELLNANLYVQKLLREEDYFHFDALSTMIADGYAFRINALSHIRRIIVGVSVGFLNLESLLVEKPKSPLAD